MTKYEIHLAVQQIQHGKETNHYNYTIEEVTSTNAGEAKRLIESKYAGRKIRIQRIEVVR